MKLLDKLYANPVYAAAARIIGYGGCSPFEFWDAAKLLPIYNQPRFMTAVYDLTRTDRREASPSRYELNGPAREACWMLLGPPPEKEDQFWRHPDGTPRERPKKEEPREEAPAEPKPKTRGRRKKG
jgi:hypothetical protein